MVMDLAMAFPTLCFDSILKMVVHRYTKIAHLIQGNKQTDIKMSLAPYFAMYFLSVVGLLRTLPMVIRVLETL